MSLIDGSDAGDRAGRVVQDLVGDMRSYPESRHAGDRSPAEVMKTPAGDAGSLVELRLGMNEVAERLVAGAEYVAAGFRPCVDDAHHYVGQMHDVRLAVLRSGAGDRPNLLFKIELIPGHLGDFLPALRCQSEKLNDAAVGSPDLPGCFDDPGELVIAQHTVTRDLASGLLDALTRRAIDDRPTDAPGEEGLCHLQGLLAATGAPRSTISLTSSMTSRRVTSWIYREPHRRTISRFRMRLISAAERRFETCCLMNASTRSSTLSVTSRRRASRFSVAGSRPSVRATSTRWASFRATCSVTRP